MSGQRRGDRKAKGLMNPDKRRQRMGARAKRRWDRENEDEQGVKKGVR